MGHVTGVSIVAKCLNWKEQTDGAGFGSSDQPDSATAREKRDVRPAGINIAGALPIAMRT